MEYVFFCMELLFTFQVSTEEENMTSKKVKHVNQACPLSKLASKFINPVELLPTMTTQTRVVTDVSKTSATGNSVELQTKISSRRKSGIVMAFSKRDNWFSETIIDNRSFSYPFNSGSDIKVLCLLVQCPLHSLITSKNICNYSY
jgi:hypothetical protein